MTSAPLSRQPPIRQPVYDAIASITPPGTLDDPAKRLAIDNILDAIGAPVDRVAEGVR